MCRTLSGLTSNRIPLFRRSCENDFPPQVKAVANYNGSEGGKLDTLANLLKAGEWRTALFQPAAMRVLSGVASSSVPVM